MNRLSFWLAKRLGDERRLVQISLPWPSLESELSGKSVGLVGNARSLSSSSFGAEIDSLDLVIRLNGAPIVSSASHGNRTDWIAMSIPVGAATLASRRPRRLLWMTPRRKRLPWRLANRSDLFLYPVDMHDELSESLGSRPTTGLMVIDLLRRSRAARADLFGFDFFESLSLTGSRTARQLNHDFQKEKTWVTGLLERDKRFRLRRAGPQPLTTAV
jgi:hypothetical protein